MKRYIPWLAALFCLIARAAYPQPGTQLRFCIASQPKTLDPLMVIDESSETVRYLTAGVLVRLNRKTQELEPALASSWTVSPDGRTITFTLRNSLRFSDGTPFSASDVDFTVRRMMDPATHSPVGDAFRSTNAASQVITRTLAPNRIAVTFPAPIVGLDRLFDQVGILSKASPQKEMAVLGPYHIAESKSGSYLLLRRNPNYWKRDSVGRSLPYIESVRLDIQQNRDAEMLRLVRGEVHLINGLDPDNFDRLRAQSPQLAVDAGVGLDSEQLWFNQVAVAPIPAYKKAWFTSMRFRNAVSGAINRDDLARIVYRGHAQPALGFISPANKVWFNDRLPPHRFDPQTALALLRQDGFQLQGSTLRDRAGNAVEFSVITNAGNKNRERMAAMIQQDLARIGIRLNIVTLDFPSLIERITRTFNYEACLLGFVNDELDPNVQMNVWLSSADNHQWNPNQKTPATTWEAEVDRLMRAQAATLDFRKRKQALDRVQQIVREQEPFIYLVNKEALAAIDPAVHNANPVALRPQTFWNIDQMSLGAQGAGKR
jgi:peptide/nickel transport system substrate-binding protein